MSDSVVNGKPVYRISFRLSNLHLICFAGTISSLQRGTQCAELTKIIIIRVEGRNDEIRKEYLSTGY